MSIRGPGPVWSGVVTRGSTQLQHGGPTIWKPFWVFVIFTRLEEGWLPPLVCVQMGQCYSSLEPVRTQEPDLVFGNLLAPELDRVQVWLSHAMIDKPPWLADPVVSWIWFMTWLVKVSCSAQAWHFKSPHARSTTNESTRCQETIHGKEISKCHW